MSGDLNHWEAQAFRLVQASNPRYAHLSLVRLAFLIANRAVVSDIESECVALEGGWWDVRPMLDPREHSPEVVDMVREAIDYALASQLAVRHPQHAHLLRLRRSLPCR